MGGWEEEGKEEEDQVKKSTEYKQRCVEGEKNRKEDRSKED